jgi:DNA-binding CsgD family transcriptional regulator
VHAGDVVEVLALWFVGDEEERAGWLEDRVRDLGAPDDWADEQVPHLWYVAQALGAQWSGRPADSTRWIELLRAAEPTPWSVDAVEWLDARSDPSSGGADRLRRVADSGLPQMPTLTALLRYDAARTAPEDVARARVAATGLRQLGAELLAARLPEVSLDRDATVRPLLSALSDREREVAALVLEGLSYAQVAKELFITRSTVSFHLSRIYAKTGTGSRHELIAAARRAAV